MSETRLSKRCMNWLRKTYPQGVHENRSDRYESGVLDGISFINGCVLIYEAKVPGKKPTHLQKYKIKMINANGTRNIRAFWFDNFEDFKSVVTNTIKWHGNKKRKGVKS